MAETISRTDVPTVTAESLTRIQRPKIAADATQAIGNTPLIELARFGKDLPARIVGKIESFSPGFSVKDRIGFSIINDAEE